MFKNYFITACRNAWRNKAFSTINVLGLSIGISAALVIFLIVAFEFGFDRFEKDRERIYRVVLDANFNGNEGHSAAVPAPLSTAIPQEVTGVEQTVPVMTMPGDGTAKVTIQATNGGPRVFKKQPDIIFTNEEYFRLLPYRWIAGSVLAAMDKPFAVVLTATRASVYFPGMPPAEVIGKQVMYNEIVTTVTGVVKDLDEQTTFAANEFISFPTIAETGLKNQFMMTTWNDWMAYSQLFVKVAAGHTATNVETQLNGLLKKHIKETDKSAFATVALRLQPLNDLHFNGNYAGFGQRIAQKPTLYGLLAVAGFILLLGCINFINLTTAQSSHRAKEIGIRKTMGSSKNQLVVQFLSETFFITIVATILSVLFTPLLLKMFENFIPAGLHFDLFHQPLILLFLVLLVLLVSFLSGVYPALILAAFKPVLVLKNQLVSGNGQTRNARVRKMLTISQFVIAQFFVIGTFVVSKQIDFSLNADMGFNKTAVINIDLPRDTIASHGKQLLQEFKDMPGIAAISTGFLAPADKGVSFTSLSYNNGKEDLTPTTQIRWGDPEFIKVYEIKLLAGKNIQPSDTIKEFLVNESYAHAIGFKHAADALNQQLDWNGKKVPIVGIVKDYHDQSMRANISPVVFGGASGSTFHIRLKPNNAGGLQWKTTLTAIQQSFKKMYPEEGFKYSFLDDTIASFYEQEQQTASLLRWAAGISVFISCMGLLGLVLYTTTARTKEVGIRKVLGASVANIIAILSKDFIQVILIAFLIAAPLAWWASYKWLQDFVFRTELSWWVFGISGLGMILMALLTLSIQTVKTAIANPVKSLRTE